MHDSATATADVEAAQPAGQPAASIGRIAVPKASDLLAMRLREQILSGAFAVGDVLPTERDLVRETGLGRSSVREALRILENQGLIVTRPGRNGGSQVQRPNRGAVEDSIALFIRGQALRLGALLDVREGVEPVAAKLAALHRTSEDLDRLDALGAELAAAHAAEDVPRFLRLNLDWHLAVVRASRNELLIAFMSAISQAIHAATDLENFNPEGVRAATLRIHDRVVAAIRAGDADAAERRMRRHVHAYVEHVEARATAAAAGGAG